MLPIATELNKRQAQTLADRNTLQGALQIGDSIPQEGLLGVSAVTGETFDVGDLVRQRPLVIKFFRGSW